MKITLVAILSFLKFFALPLSLAAPPPAVTTTCTNNAQNGLNYCVIKPVKTTNQDILYYFHGLQGNVHEWQNLPGYGTTYQTWANQAPIVVTISFGPIWLLAERNASASSGLYESFIFSALPFIEKSENLHPLHRLLMGLSMGGFNAAQIYLKNPSLFSKVALACPALTRVGPYSGQNAIQEYITRTHAQPSQVEKALSVSSSFFPDETSWETADSIALASKLVNPNFPPLFASGGMQDEYGFFEGALAFVNAISIHGAQAHFTELQGGHCTYDWIGTANFLVP
jgi:S-formylglutathione hydrolase FrmB